MHAFLLLLAVLCACCSVAQAQCSFYDLGCENCVIGFPDPSANATGCAYCHLSKNNGTCIPSNQECSSGKRINAIEQCQNIKDARSMIVTIIIVAVIIVLMVPACIVAVMCIFGIGLWRTQDRARRVNRSAAAAVAVPQPPPSQHPYQPIVNQPAANYGSIAPPPLHVKYPPPQ